MRIAMPSSEDYSPPTKKGHVSLLFLSFLFVLVLISLFFLYRHFAKKDAQNYTLALKNNIETLIESKKNMTIGLAKKLALDPKLIEVMKTRQYALLYDKDFFLVGREFGNFKQLGIHVSDQSGVNRFFSWTHKAIGMNALKWRKDLALFYQNPKPVVNISVGKFDMTFKGTAPILDHENRFLGVVETITHFNSIAKYLAKKNIYSAVVIDKRFNKQLEYPHSPHFIDGHRISNTNLEPFVAEFLKKYGVKYFSQNAQHNYVLPDKEYIKGYYAVSVPIKGVYDKAIGHYVAFAYDQFALAAQRFILYGVMGFLTALFFYVAYLARRKNRENDYLIQNLDQEVIKKTNENIELLSSDSLTGSCSKDKFLNTVHKYNGQYAVLLNIRNFSKINEVYNFKVGDDILKLVVQRIEALLSRKIYRIHGDEFAFMTKQYKKDIAAIQKLFLQTSVWTTEQRISLRLIFSFGVAKIIKDHYMLRELAIAIKSSKKMLYRDYVFYRPKVSQNDFIAINALLHDALNKESHTKIVPYFQAIIDNRSGKIKKHEALVRLISGKKIYQPLDFLDVAHSSGMIPKLTEKMIQKSLALFSKLEDEKIGISFNITEDDLLALKLPGCLVEQCKYYNVKPERVTLEILEGVTTRAAKKHIIQLELLRREGFQLAIDDFGVEYSNFERIVDAEIDLIKIDSKYIKNLTKDPKSWIIVQAITNSAHKLGIEVVAEYVENEEIQSAVKGLGIDYSQGYFFSEPSPTFV